MVLLGNVIEMKHFFWLILRLLAGLTALVGSRGPRAVLAENLLLRRQLLVLRRSWRRAPNLEVGDRLVFGFCSMLLSRRRLLRIALILRPSTLLRCHRGLQHFKYRFLYSSRPKNKPGPSGPTPGLIQVICEVSDLRQSRRSLTMSVAAVKFDVTIRRGVHV
jgi:putative transposase